MNQIEEKEKPFDLKARHKINPFLKSMVVTTAKKQVRVTNLGKDKQVLFNEETGEIQGTHVVSYKKVDDAEFVKIFSANIALTFGLKSAGIKAFNVLIWSVQHTAINRDEVILDSRSLSMFLETHELKLSLAVFQRGINELERAEILAKTIRKGFYFINPNFVFNGNRIAFTTVIERKSNISREHEKSADEIEREKLEKNGQQRIE